MPQTRTDAVHLADVVTAQGGARPEISILEAEQPLPWAGHTTRYAAPDILAAITAHDGEAARQAMLDHLLGVEALVLGPEAFGKGASPSSPRGY